jgi:hypothetical protein
MSDLVHESVKNQEIVQSMCSLATNVAKLWKGGVISLILPKSLIEDG